MLFKRVLTICFLLMFLDFVFPSFAYAYLDPGTGSYIFQLIIAGAVGLFFVAKVYWKRLGAFFASLFSKDGETDEDA